ncbi:MAG: hypothetical protein Q7S65_04010 [Nanoarchaeota archaeon]|nr:hypothetical protein [Nanoarchaeota archaeon]
MRTGFFVQRGTLEEQLGVFDPESVLQAFEILEDARADEEFRQKPFRTGEFALYTVESGEAVLYLAPTPLNLAFQNKGIAIPQLRNGDYVPQPDEARRVIAATDRGVLRVPLLSLQMEEDRSPQTCFYVHTGNDQGFTPARRNVTEWIYARKGGFEDTRRRIGEFRAQIEIQLLSPKYVLSRVRGDISAIARICHLGRAIDGTRFSAACQDVDHGYQSMAGSALVSRAI